LTGDHATSAPLRFDPLVPTVYHEPWWLAAATDGRYDEITLTENGRKIARFPYVIHRGRTGHTTCGMPVLTHFLGPAIDTGEAAPTNKSLKQAAILRELLSRVPSTSGFYQKLHRDLTDTLVFQEQRYDSGVQFTYEIQPAPEAVLWSAMRDKTRNAIRAAERLFTVSDEPDPARFAALYEANLARKGRANNYQHVAAVSDVAIRLARGRIIAAFNQAREPVAAIFYAWDARAAYYVLTTRSEQAGNGAVSLLLWHAMRDCARRGLIFDFDGVAEPGSRVFYTGFGGLVAPRYIVSRYNLRHQLANSIGNPFRASRRNHYQ